MNKYPISFWFLILTEAFMAGGYAISFPFLAIYLNSIRNINMSIVGIFLSLSMLLASISNIYGGELSDRIGRKKVMLISLFARSVIILAIAIVIKYNFPVFWLFLLHPLGLFCGSLFNPAAKAWIAEAVSPEKRLKAYGIMRIGTNSGWAIGPSIGGLIAISSYSKMFFITGLIYFLSAFIIFFSMQEMKNFIKLKNKVDIFFSKKMFEDLFKDKIFYNFCIYSFIISAVMSQLVVPVSLYSKNYLFFSEKQIGFLFTINGSMVVFLQYLVSYYFSKFSIFYSLSIGSLLYAIGYFIFGFSKFYFLAVFSMIIVTFGELSLSPSLSTFVADISPTKKQGRYMGIASMVQQIGNSFGIFLGSFLIDNFAKYYQQISWTVMFFLGVFAFYGFNKMRKFSFKEKLISKDMVPLFDLKN